MEFDPLDYLNLKNNGSSLEEKYNTKKVISRDTSNSRGQQSQKITTL